ncbi:hypothetical protein Ancab_004522 [Ancistrocladus abbreviatus]
MVSPFIEPQVYVIMAMICYEGYTVRTLFWPMHSYSAPLWPRVILRNPPSYYCVVTLAIDWLWLMDKLSWKGTNENQWFGNRGGGVYVALVLLTGLDNQQRNSSKLCLALAITSKPSDHD